MIFNVDTTLKKDHRLFPVTSRLNGEQGIKVEEEEEKKDLTNDSKMYEELDLRCGADLTLIDTAVMRLT